MRKPALAVTYADAVSYRIPMQVSAVRRIRSVSGSTTFPLCPRCEVTIEREYQTYCDRCGQALGWTGFHKVVVIATP